LNSRDTMLIRPATNQVYAQEHRGEVNDRRILQFCRPLQALDDRLSSAFGNLVQKMPGAKSYDSKHS